MNTNHNFDPLVIMRHVIFMFPIFLSACQASDDICKMPSHWLSKSQPNPEISPKSLVTVSRDGQVEFNKKVITADVLIKSLDKVSKFDRSELIDVRISSQLSCDRAKKIISVIDKSAKCKTSSYCRGSFF